MNALIVCGLVVVLLWALMGRRLEGLGVTGPVAVVALGAVSAVFFGESLGAQLNTQVAEKVVEVILAILLFVDATEVRRGFLGGEAKTVARLLGIALPLALVATMGVGLLLIPGASWVVVLLIACIVVPIDFSTANGILRDSRLPSKIRNALNVESGYNDGIVSPLFVFALVVAEAEEAASAAGLSTGAAPDLLAMLQTAVWASAIAIVVGGLIGGAIGYLARHAVASKWVTAQSLRIGVVVVPLLVYVVTVAADGNGFVAAFVAGIAFRVARGGRRSSEDKFDSRELSAVDDIGAFAALGMWFVFGMTTVLALGTGVEWGLVVFGVVALTLLRMIPVYIAMLGSPSSWRERTVIGLSGPRGTASIVFALLAYNALNDDDGDIVLYATSIVVLGSLLVHGVIAPRVVPLLLGSQRTSTS